MSGITRTPVRFVAPPFGLEPKVDFVLDEIEGAVGLFALRAVDVLDAADDAADVRLFVLDASVHLTDYSPVITDEQTALLELTDADDAMLLVVATPASSGMTVNLLAPVVVNRVTGAGAQLILEGQDWPLRAELGPR
ncbi:flagellar assembly protein FliW [Frigoribacterium sp. CFBP 13712]|uniref:flagellar assembly protein FliW n=1 Tax=Frigoribacterium sp. CFBP 13712 TaxID=2775309 RepID=UPI00177B9125|nr:flagellar assembly protein FliW [Frigoribacterium sp. CFBP 13712]MBD8704111.1 flagellar assembly protein FliW [Frigoribacterium sp. CFBP 13712]